MKQKTKKSSVPEVSVPPEESAPVATLVGNVRMVGGVPIHTLRQMTDEEKAVAQVVRFQEMNLPDYERRQWERAARARALRERNFLEMCPERFHHTDRHYLPANPWVPKVDWAAFDRVQEYRFGKKGLLLAGSTGLGKSRALWTLLRRLAVDDLVPMAGDDPGEMRPLRVAAFESLAFANHAESLHELGRGKFSEWMVSLTRPDVLFLDDYGKFTLVGSRDDWIRDQLGGLVDARYARNRPMFYTTNQSAKEMKAGGGSWGDALMRRILETCDIIEFQGQP